MEQGSHFLEFVPEFFPHVLKFVTNNRVAFRDLSDVTTKGLCHDAKVECDGRWFSSGSHSCLDRVSCAA